MVVKGRWNMLGTGCLGSAGGTIPKKLRHLHNLLRGSGSFRHGEQLIGEVPHPKWAWLGVGPLPQHIHLSTTTSNGWNPNGRVIPGPKIVSAGRFQTLMHGSVKIVPTISNSPEPTIETQYRVIICNHTVCWEVFQVAVGHPSLGHHLGGDIRTRKLSVGCTIEFGKADL